MQGTFNFSGHPGITGNGGNDSAPDMNRTGSSENNANSDANAGKVSKQTIELGHLAAILLTT